VAWLPASTVRTVHARKAKLEAEMDVSKLRGGELIAAIGGVVLLVALLFLNWYGVGGSVETGFGEIEVGGEFGAWDGQGFFGTLANLVILAAGVFAVGLAILTATSRTVALPIAASALTALLGFGAVLMVLLRMLFQPGEGEFVDLEFGIYLALIGAIAVAYGGWQSMKEEGTTFQDARDRLQSRMGDEGPVPAEAAASGTEVEGSTAPPGTAPAGDVSVTPTTAAEEIPPPQADELAATPPPAEEMPLPAPDEETRPVPPPAEERPPAPPPTEEVSEEERPPAPPPASEEVAAVPPPATEEVPAAPAPAPEGAEEVPPAEEPGPEPFPEPSPPASPGEAQDEEEEHRPPGL